MEVYELIILGGGPAGTAASVYAGRKKIKGLLITENFGGQAVVADKIENFIGQLSLSGVEMAKIFEEQVRRSGLAVILDEIQKIEKEKDYFLVKTSHQGDFFARFLLVALGRKYKNLNVPGEEKFKGRGVVYCSTCDAPLFKDKPVAVVGGGNSALLSVLDLLSYASKIYLLNHSEEFRADPVLIERVKKEEKVEFIFPAEVKEIFGNFLVEGLKYQDLKTQEIKELAVKGVFVQIGMKPNTELLENLLELNENKEIIVEPLTGRTSCPGIWAAGDITNLPHKQISVAIGDGIRALLDIYKELRNLNLKEFI